MKVFKRPGSRFFTYKCQHKGKEYYRSTGTANRRDAEDIAAAARRSIIRQLGWFGGGRASEASRGAKECANSSPIPSYL
jgi:hypothetical protein